MNLFDRLQVTIKHGRSHITLPLAHMLLGSHTDSAFIVAYPRSGSTWLRTMLCNILIPEAQGDPRIFNVVIPGVSLRRLPLVRRAREAGYRFVHSHTTYRRGFSKVLYLVRDGRDALVSQYHYNTTRNGKEMNFPIWFELYRLGLYGKRWHNHVESWLVQGKSELGSDMLTIRFEDLKQDTLAVMQKVTDFLDIIAPREMIEQAIRDASIEKSRYWEKKLVGQPKTDNASFYRGGRSKQWKDYFGEKELNQFMDMSERTLRLAGYL